MRDFLYKSVVFCFFICICWQDISAPLEAAMDGMGSKHISTGRILEFSLKNLKGSLQKTEQKNDRLAFENAAIRKDIQYLKRMLKNLSLKKSELLGGPPMPRYQEDQALLTRILNGKERRRRTRELIAIFEEDASVLREEIQLLDNQLAQDQFNSQKRLLSDKKKESRENYSKLKKRLKVLDKTSRGPQKVIKELEKKKSILEKKLAALQNRAIGH